MMVARLGGSPAGPSAPAMSGEVTRAAGAASASSFGSSITAAWNARLQLKGRSPWPVGGNPSLFRGGARASVSGKGGVSDTWVGVAV